VTRGVGDVLGPAASLEKAGVALGLVLVLVGLGVGRSSSSSSTSAFEGFLKNDTIDDCFCNVGVFAAGVLFEAEEGVTLGFLADWGAMLPKTLQQMSLCRTEFED